MSEQKHTPGPWTVELGRMRADSEVFGFGIFADNAQDGRRHSLASANLYEQYAFGAFYRPEEIEANARLIAAAPDFLIKAQEFIAPYAALSDEFLVEIALSEPGNAYLMHGTVSLTSHVAASVMAFRAVIAEAEGRS